MDKISLLIIGYLADAGHSALVANGPTTVPVKPPAWSVVVKAASTASATLVQVLPSSPEKLKE